MSAVSKSLRKELHLKPNEEAYEINLGGVCRGGACCMRRTFVVTHNQILYQEDPLCATKTTKSISIQKVTDVSIVQPCCWCIDDLTLDTGSGQELYVVCCVHHNYNRRVDFFSHVCGVFLISINL